MFAISFAAAGVDATRSVYFANSKSLRPTPHSVWLTAFGRLAAYRYATLQRRCARPYLRSHARSTGNPRWARARPAS